MIIVVMIVMVIVVMAVVIVPVVVPPMFFFVAVFFHTFMAEAFGGALTFAAFEEFVPFLVARPFKMPDGVRMNIGCAVHPGPAPTYIVDEDSTVLPYDAVCSPSPGPEHWP